MSNNANDRKAVVGFLRVMVVLVAILLVILLIIIFFGIMGQNKDESLGKDDVLDVSEVSSEEEVDTATEQEPVPNGDAAGIDPDSWMADKKIYDPQMTDSTMHLAAADMNKFDEIIANSAGNDTSNEEDGEGGSAWDSVSLTLDSVDGSINFSTPGDPIKTQQLTSTYMILVDLDSDTIVAERSCEQVVSPASMTKILTVLTARDYIDETTLADKFTVSAEITDYVRKNDCSAVGFTPNSEVTVRDLLYGTILPSGADAALGLAEYCCGSQEAFVEAMNKKVEELGLSETAHFTNVVGIYDPDLHCTMKDMAVILGVAVQDDLLRDVLSCRTYSTDATFIYSDTTEEGTSEEDVPEEDKKPIEVSNWFLRKIEDKDMDGDVIAAKTGFVNESGCCAASYYEADNGKKYICVTGNAFSSWRAIYDHVSVYRSLTD
ncbi:MAG: serine hydrolase [Eubacterium sp.]|nr:serine hydrolase [Eubacterium sp.]